DHLELLDEIPEGRTVGDLYRVLVVGQGWQRGPRRYHRTGYQRRHEGRGELSHLRAESIRRTGQRAGQVRRCRTSERADGKSVGGALVLVGAGAVDDRVLDL